MRHAAPGPLREGGAASLGCLAALLLAFQPLPSSAASDVFMGVPRVVDGDTMVVAQQRVRMFGIDAPESKQPCLGPTGEEYACGLASKQALERKIGGAPVVCQQKDKDMYARSVAVCSLTHPRGGEPEDLSAWMVQQGHAVAYRQYSKQYVPLEGQAREARRGIWAGTFQQPRDWRRENKHRGTATPVAAPVPPVAVVAAPAAVPAPAAPCVIKGNITGRGKKIYHLPGSRSYDATVIDSSKGERLFCTVAEAEAAGWRAVI